VARLGLDWGFGELGLDEIEAQALDANQASVRILVSLGMTEIGRGDDEAFLGVASYYRRFSIRRAEWCRSRSW
jgi:RimJ/RimL family protein N-acetyltransferase